MVVLLRSLSLKWLSAAWSLASLSFLLELDFFNHYAGQTTTCAGFTIRWRLPSNE
jgi:hypothetical protein